MVAEMERMQKDRINDSLTGFPPWLIVFLGVVKYTEVRSADERQEELRNEYWQENQGFPPC